MSEQSSPPQPALRPETQSERRLKYGVNVGVAIIAAIVASGVIVSIVQSHDRRLDTTAAGELSTTSRAKSRSSVSTPEPSRRLQTPTITAQIKLPPRPPIRHR
jgi:hypothetical protein